MKKVWTSVLAAGLLAALPTTAMAVPVDNVAVYYNDTKLETTQPLENWNSRILLAFRDYFEGLGIPVDWNDSTRLATVNYEGKTVLLEPDTGRIYVDGQLQKTDVGPRIVNDRIYVPLRFLSETFDCTVDYDAPLGGQATVRITSKDAPVNYVVEKEGGITRIVRRSAAPVSTTEAATPEEKAAYAAWQRANTAYFVDKQGHLTEVTTHDDQLSLLQIDTAKASETKKDYEAGSLYTTLGNFERVNGHYQAPINRPADNDRYLGVGQPIGGTNYVGYISTFYGTVPLYRSESTQPLLDIDDEGVVSFTEDNRYGYVLDLASIEQSVSTAAYAEANNGSYAFLINGELIILDEHQEVVSQQMVSGTMKDARMAAYGDKFVIMAIENDNNGDGDLYTAIYNTDGDAVRGYFRSSNTVDRAYAQIYDIEQDGGTIYVLMHTSWEDHLITIDVSKNSVDAEMLTRYYQNIIPTAKGFALFCAEQDYYYLKPLE